MAFVRQSDAVWQISTASEMLAVFVLPGDRNGFDCSAFGSIRRRNLDRPLLSPPRKQIVWLSGATSYPNLPFLGLVMILFPSLARAAR
jgi:hypothetical protein